MLARAENGWHAFLPALCFYENTLCEDLLTLHIRGDDPLAKCQTYQLDIGADAELGADEITGIGCGFDADMQRFGDVIDGLFGQQHPQDFEFPRAPRVDLSLIHI